MITADHIPVMWFETGKYRFDADGDLQRRCAKCRQYYEPDSVSFYASRQEPDGLHRWCKTCWRARRVQRIHETRRPAA